MATLLLLRRQKFVVWKCNKYHYFNITLSKSIQNYVIYSWEYRQRKSKVFFSYSKALKIHGASTPSSAKKLGGQRSGPCQLRPDWEEVKVDLMREILLCKFSQNGELKAVLLSTGDRQLREHTPRDKFWGDGGKKGKGKNMLGKLLMAVREELKEDLD